MPSSATPREDECSSGAVKCTRVTSILQPHLLIWSPPNSDPLSQAKQFATIDRKKYMLTLQGQCSIQSAFKSLVFLDKKYCACNDEGCHAFCKNVGLFVVVVVVVAESGSRDTPLCWFLHGI